MLQFLLPRISGLGIWQLDTSSINSILNINAAVALLKQVLGKVALLPLTLRVVPIEVSPEGKKKTVYVLQLDIPVKLGDLGSQLLLPAAEDETPELLYPTPDEEAARDAAEEVQPVAKVARIPASPFPKPAPVPVPKARQQLIADYQTAARLADQRGIVFKHVDKDATADTIAAITLALEDQVKAFEARQQPAKQAALV